MFELLVPAIGIPLAKFLAKEWLADSAVTAIAGGAIDYLTGIPHVWMPPDVQAVF
jgi:hypothetical protein